MMPDTLIDSAIFMDAYMINEWKEKRESNFIFLVASFFNNGSVTLLKRNRRTIFS